MKIEYVFYIIGVVFIFAAVMYFAWEFIAELPDPIKLVVLVISVIVAFVVAELFRGGDL